MYTKIHVAVDGSEQSKGAASFGLELAEMLGSRLAAVHVKENSRADARIARLRAMLPNGIESTDTNGVSPSNGGKVRTGWLADDADDVGVSFGSERLEGVPHEALLTYMGDSEEDLLVVGAWGASGGGKAKTRVLHLRNTSFSTQRLQSKHCLYHTVQTSTTWTPALPASSMQGNNRACRRP